MTSAVGWLRRAARYCADGGRRAAASSAARRRRAAAHRTARARRSRSGRWSRRRCDGAARSAAPRVRCVRAPTSNRWRTCTWLVNATASSRPSISSRDQLLDRLDVVGQAPLVGAQLVDRAPRARSASTSSGLPPPSCSSATPRSATSASGSTSSSSAVVCGDRAFTSHRDAVLAQHGGRLRPATHRRRAARAPRRARRAAPIALACSSSDVAPAPVRKTTISHRAVDAASRSAAAASARDVHLRLGDRRRAHGLASLAAHELRELARESCLEQPDARAAEQAHASALHVARPPTPHEHAPVRRELGAIRPAATRTSLPTGAARREIELVRVQRADHLAVADDAVGEQPGLVRAARLRREHLVRRASGTRRSRGRRRGRSAPRPAGCGRSSPRSNRSPAPRNALRRSSRILPRRTRRGARPARARRRTATDAPARPPPATDRRTRRPRPASRRRAARRSPRRRPRAGCAASRSRCAARSRTCARGTSRARGSTA